MNATPKTTLTIMDTFDFKKKSTDGDYAIINCPNPANAASTDTTNDDVGSAFEGLEYAQAIGFDGDGSGRKHYIAAAGYDVKNSAVWLTVCDARTQETVKMLIGITLPDYLNSTQEGVWSEENFLAITAGDYDKDGKESVILYYQDVYLGSFGLWEVTISEHEGALTWDDCHTECILDLNKSLDGIFNESRKSDFTGESAKKMPAVSLATGDFNGDGTDQLAAAFSFYNPSDDVKNGYVDTLCGEDGLDPFIMTRVVIFDRTSSGWQHTAPIMMYDIVASEYETSGSDVIYPVNMMHGGRIAAGDVDNNGVDEIVVVGYGSMATKAEHTTAYARVTYRNGKPYSVSHIGDFMRDKLFSSVIYYGGGGYVKTSLQRFQMQQAITTTFARNIDDKYSVFAPIAVACARTNGHNQPAVVFINGVLYDFSKKKPTVLCDDTFIGKNDLGQEAWYNPDTGPRKYVMNWVRNVAVGNFDGNTAGREQFIFTFWQSKYAGQYDSWLSVIAGVDYGDELDPSGSMTFGTPAKYACNFIPLDFECNVYNHDLLTGDAQWGAMIHNGATTDAAGSTRLAAIPVAVDADDDGTLGRFNKSGYVYTDPEVMAVLEAAPYFSEVEEAGGYSGDGETSYSFSVEYGSGTSRTDSLAFEVGVAAEVAAGPVKVSLEAGYANDWSHTFEQVYSVSVEES